MQDNDYSKYDAFASEAFAVLYPLYATKIMERTGKRTGKVLDLGSGGGHLGFALMDAGSFDHVTFADLSEPQLERARLRSQARGYAPDECSFAQVDAVDLSMFPDESFDLVVSRGSMQFWSDKDAAFREIYRVLKHGGYAYIGGGVGTNYRLTHRVSGLIADSGHGHGGADADDAARQSAHRQQSRNAQCGHFAELFAELGCSYCVMNSKAEGGWYIFCKDDGLQW